MRLHIITPYAEEPSYVLGDLLEGYQSLVWTERMYSPGEFELVTSDLSRFDAVVPGILLGIYESNEVMLVETRNIRRNQDGHDELVISGRSVSFIIDERIIWAPTPDPLVMPQLYTSQEIAAAHLWNILVNTDDDDAFSMTLRPPAIYMDSPIPEVVITDSFVETLTTKYRLTATVGQAGQFIRDHLAQEKAGLRIIRPGEHGDVWVYSVDIRDGANKGFVTVTEKNVDTKLRFDIFQGTDRSTSQTDNPQIIFSFKVGTLSEGEIIDSDKDWATTALLTAPPSYVYATSVSLSTHPGAGFSIKIRHVDASDLIKGLTGSDITKVVERYMKKYWRDHSGRALVDGEAAPGSEYKYGIDYGLGDIVTLEVSGIKRNVYVSEYTRYEDHMGNREYPTFASVSP